ncbi:ATP synthase F1 complex subunit gamma [Candidatus Bealeia paramacronuclearis]|uniref:ATP synthase gamma chain n=1 Tax=Candidatus Bealeia paramacronuclearis TaxID=1921001 RepID=A0ABZ2C4Y8_9PROT|nr:ATP synthase F1 complex subunit gamma [Candidatus Bealeia paramacronuclearis]
MATLKQIRDRKKTVQSTRKITIAMKMVAGAKLRRAQEQVEAGRPYAKLMQRMLEDLAKDANAFETPQPLLSGTGKSEKYLLIVATSDRGLCGAFNSSIVRQARREISTLRSDGKDVSIICIGRKGRDLLKRDYGSLIIETFTEIGQKRIRFSDAQKICDSIIGRFQDGQFDVCQVVYNQFVTAMTQKVTAQQLIPLKIENTSSEAQDTSVLRAVYEYEPNEDVILNQLLPQNLAIQIFNILLENAASEQGARMTAMDNASRNAADMIKKLELTYNRMRQAHITKELIEIISGAEALS